MFSFMLIIAVGFLPALDGGASRGNFGLMDQVAALHWIQENIAEFGGDPMNVTLAGHGYGAACTNLLMVSPMVRGKIHFIFFGNSLCTSSFRITERERKPDKERKSGSRNRMISLKNRLYFSVIERERETSND